MLRRQTILFAIAVFLVGVWNHKTAAEERKIEFNRDIRPILSNNCFVCHGPDNKLRKGDLRLDQAKGLYEDLGGYKIIDPKHPEKSELIFRITTKRASRRMPPPSSQHQLTKAEIDLLKRWIAQGGEYQGHWSFLAEKKPALPKVTNDKRIRNPIDRFVLARLAKEGIEPSPEADRRTLIRRLSFDLTGLPPSPKQVEAFLADESPKAYENLVDRLLSSRHHGERMAVYWLDVVRYADTGGYHSDNHRDIALYRNYVINAFNNNKAYDEFVTEQLAGDLLPNRTKEQWIASGFNRLLQTTQEGGSQPKEYTAKYAADRVRNTGVIFLGVTLGCAECHDHKYDPISTKEFYQFAAFFADISERAVGKQPQTRMPTPEQTKRLADLAKRITAITKQIAAKGPQLRKAQQKWELDVKGRKYKGVPGNLVAIMKLPEKRRNGNQKKALANHFRSISKLVKVEQQQLTKLQREQKALEKEIPQTLVSMSQRPRTMRILPRGNWLDDSGEVVQPALPESILAGPKTKGRLNRLDLAKWMIDEDNPLTARVFVNRLWMLFYGQGIVKSVDDFGGQGTWPTHPALLDWLATEFRESGWDVRHMIKLMVTSRTYRQTSVVGADLRKRDPYNQLLARQARFRLDAEMVRDNALAISGLLSKKIGGPSVKPYQPAGYWQHLNFPRRRYTPNKDEDQYRRGLYTYWQRTFLHPSLLAFDAPTREECTAQRPRSNTPQQALVLLNDPTYVEAARVFAAEVLREGNKDFGSRLEYAYRKALSRSPLPVEEQILKQLYHKHLQDYQKDVKAAEALLQVGYYPSPTDLPKAEAAAWTSVTRVILNLHETITRQ
ncbi:MAG: PSD1 and planctomycete cytochrome C domain-containing protein [Gemmataceae bacterium]